MHSSSKEDLQDPQPTGDEGQAAISLIVILALFLLAALGFSVDITNILFHRQAARSAADAACQAGAMDMLAANAGMPLSGKGFTVGTAGDCAGSPSATMCAYATANGYTGTGIVAGAKSVGVSWSFPSSVPGVSAAGTNPFLTVTVAENVRTYFMSLVKATTFETVSVSCTCGVVQVKSAAPMVVLHPTMSGAFNYSGGGLLQIVGGPGRGLQVNSSSSTAVQWAASGSINLSAGGSNGTGSDVGIVGGPSAIPGSGTCNSNSGFCGGTTGSWRANSLPVADPYGNLGVPSSVKQTAPTLGVSGQWVAYGVDGCPDHVNRAGQTNSYCREFSPGYYPNGLTLPDNYSTIIFQPGIYYLNGSLVASGSNTLRMAKPSGYQQTDGLMFYFLTGSINVSGCSGCAGSNIDNVTSTDLTCDGSSPPPGIGLPSTVSGNVLWGQCANNGTYWDSGGDTTDSRGGPGSRGLLIFQDHANQTSPAFTGSGQLAFSGSLYFHNSSYSSVFALNGGSSSGTYILGEIIADQVQLTGSGAIKLALNPAPTMNLSKAAILR